MNFKRNLNTLDRVFRMLVGVGCIYLGFVDTSLIENPVITTLVGAFGIINVIAAIFSYCPVYGLTGISTYRMTERNND